MNKTLRNAAAVEELKIQWHPAFCAAAQLELREDKEHLIFQQEVLLNSAPLKMDLLVIKKLADVKLKNEIGHLFRKYNILEYKSPEEGLDIDVYYKVYGYACLYKADGEKSDFIKAGEITLTFVRQRVPKKLLRWFREHGYKVTEPYPGIYYIQKDGMFDTQIITGNLSEEAHIYLSALRPGIRKETAEELLKTANDLTGKADWIHMDALLQVVLKANRNEFQGMKGVENMCDELRRLMAPEIEEELRKAKAQVTEEVTQQVTQQVTRQVTQQVTEQVTQQVTEQVTKKVEKEAAEKAAKASAEQLVKFVEAAMESFKVSLEEACASLKMTVDTYMNAKQLLSK